MMTQTSVTSGLLPFLEILSEFGRQLVGVEVQWFSGLHILLSVEEPIGNVILSGILDDRLHLFDLGLTQLAGSLPDVDLSFPTNQSRKSLADTTDFGQCDRHWLSALQFVLRIRRMCWYSSSCTAKVILIAVTL